MIKNAPLWIKVLNVLFYILTLYVLFQESPQLIVMIGLLAVIAILIAYMIVDKFQQKK